MKIIIGSNGFLGKALFKKFTCDGEVVKTLSYRSSKKEEFLKALSVLLEELPQSLIICGASQAMKDGVDEISDLVDSNVLLPAMIAALIKTISPETLLINFGSSWQIGESGKEDPLNAYAASKSAADPILDHFANDGIKIASLRLYDTYGIGDKRKKIINLLIDSLLLNENLKMTGGMQCMDLIHIDDVVDAVAKTIEHLNSTNARLHHKFYVRSFRTVTVKELAVIIAKIIKEDGFKNFEFGALPYRNRERFKLYENTLTVPNWSAKVDLYDGLREYITWKMN